MKTKQKIIKSKTQSERIFKLHSSYKPAGDQGKVIEELTSSIRKGNFEQTMLGVTGSGKTYMMAKIIENLQKPTLVVAHNKTLAAQLAEEFQRFFPDNAVHYFVSYYDYYQPESYIPRSDTYIEKQTQINEEIERLRNASTQSLLTRKDVLIVASVSCIYGLGNPEDYHSLKLELQKGGQYKLDKVLRRLVDMQFTRSKTDLSTGKFRLLGDTLELIPTNEELGYRFSFFGDELESIKSFDPLTRHIHEEIDFYTVFPAKQYVTTGQKIENGIDDIHKDLQTRIKYFEDQNLPLQAQRIKDRTLNDIEMLQSIGFVNGIENYSVYFDGRITGEPPATLIDYFPAGSLTFVDESHITLSQVAAMYNGDRSRKQTLVDYGFRLPSALDNRPLKINEFFDRTDQFIYVSATPGDFELGITDKISKSKTSISIPHKNQITVSEAIIRPTGLLDPEIILKPVDSQVDDVLERVRQKIQKGQRVLITTLTKKFAEELDIYFKQLNVKSAYIHSDVETLDRLDILSDLRRGRYDVLIGINLLREGLDLPEVGLVAVFDADKEGFLRSRTSLIQIIGRASRHPEGQVIMYADTITKSMQAAMDETTRRREIQEKYNLRNNITPKAVTRHLETVSDQVKKSKEENPDYGLAGAEYDNIQGWQEKGIKGLAKDKKIRKKTKTQVYENFDSLKDQYREELIVQNPSANDLRNRLQTAIDAMNFEEAAAIRDILDKKIQE